MTLHSDGKVLVSVKNYEAVTVRLESIVVLGQVVRPNKAADPVVTSTQSGQSSQVETNVYTTVEDSKRKLIEVLGLNSVHSRPGSRLNYDYLVIVSGAISQEDYKIEFYGFHHMKEQYLFFNHILI